MKLTSNQTDVFNKIKDNFIHESIILLSGSAGTGKTTLTKNICQYFSEKSRTICAIAPTHKSKRVIESVLNSRSIIKIPCYTVASVLGKIKEHSYIGTKKYSDPNIKKFQNYYLFILDEVSMVNDKDLQIIISYVKKSNKRLLIIGDQYQIPCPSSPIISIKNDDRDVIQKADSFIFSDESIIRLNLTEIMRQKDGSPILDLACFVRDNINNEFTINNTIYNKKYIIEYKDIYEMFKSFYLQNNNGTKMIAYTNQSVKTHNIEIRRELNYNSPFVENDILTGYNNIGWPELFIENGQDYCIIKVKKVDDYRIKNFNNLSGYLIDFKIINTDVTVNDIFFINIKSECNYDFLVELIERGEKVNSQYSTKKDYQYYMELKNCAIFTDDVYKYDNKIMTETDFKEMHPLLFTKIDDIIIGQEIIVTQLTEKINTTYPNIINIRLNDNKNISESETLSDKYKVIDKDIYYGYAITAHKSQGSTYSTVFVDEMDFHKISDKWNYKHNKLESRIREKNQLRYVSYTRAKHNLYIIQ